MSRRATLAALGAIALPAAAAAQVPAIMYHAHPNFNYTADMFRSHMDYLKDNQFTTIDMDRFLEWHRDARPLPFRPVIITVDDNYIAGYTEMYPILRERGQVAINYTHTLGIPSTSTPKAQWPQIIEMDRAGVFLVESHSRSHPRMSTISAAQLFEEVHGCRDEILAGSGKLSRHFAYPYGDYNQNVINELIAAGYLTGMTTTRGLNYRTTPIYELRRWSGDGKNLQQWLVETGFGNLPPAPPGPGWIIDDEDPHGYYTSSWAPSTSIAGYFGTRYLARPSTASALMRWAVDLPIEGPVAIHARWTPFGNRASDAVYTIRTAAGPVTVTVDQRTGGTPWVELGVFDLTPGEPVEVTLGGGTTGFLIADALWIEPRNAQAPQSQGWMVY